MKRVVSLLLAILMLTGLLAVYGTAVAAQGNTPATTTYVVYEEDFNLITGASSDDVLEALGWYIPDAKADRNIATYQIVDKGAQNNALRISTHLNDVGGIAKNSIESFVTVFGGDMMSVVRSGNFTISYDLTYRDGTKNPDGYTAMIYNYNEKDGLENGESYGIVAIRACGTGLNGIYSPLSSGGYGFIECPQNGAELTMSNRYQVSGPYQSLYSRIAETLGDTNYDAANEETLCGENRLIDKLLHVEMNYDYKNGMSVTINGVLVSEPNIEIYSNDANYSGLWGDFLECNDGAAVGFVTMENVIADIDNIKITAEKLATEGFADELPELVITEISPRSTQWADFIEIYNPSDHPVDLADYSILTSKYSDSTVYDIINRDMMMHTFIDVYTLSDYIGKVSQSLVRNVHISTLQKFYDESKLDPAFNTRYKYEDEYRYNEKGQVDPNATDTNHYRKIRYLECWNTIYDPNSVNEENFHLDTLLQPGECALIMMGTQGWDACYFAGVNAGLLSSKFNTKETCLRNLFRRSGLSKDTKIIFTDLNQLIDHDQVKGETIGGLRYYLAKTNDENGKRIPYKNYYTGDRRIDPYIVSYVDYCSVLTDGWFDDNVNNPDNGNFGYGGETWGGRCTGLSAMYVYGVDASRDPRYGTLYCNRNTMSNAALAHVGCLSGAQEIIMESVCGKSNEASPDLTITEIVPNTNNLAGEAKRAFTAIELTNTSSKEIDLYSYSLVRTLTNDNCLNGMGFSFFTKMQAGNPVEKTATNSSYYYFVQDHIANPETCVLQPGEVAVVWCLTEDTYSSYSRDDGFGFDYFRQYWVNQGNAQLAIKAADGNYATKVIAVDANVSEVTNNGNHERVFELITRDSAIYGVAKNTQELLSGNILSGDVISIAIFGSAFCYYKMEYESAVSPTTGEIFYGLILKRDLPVNTSMRYVAGGAANKKCAALANSMRVIRSSRGTAPQVFKSETPVPEGASIFKTTNAFMEVRLGTLDGKEVLPILNHLFVKEVSNTGDVTYRYFDALRTNIVTLQGAAVNAAGDKPMLRFDNAISNDVYSALVATYGDRVEIGTLIVKTEALGDKTTYTAEDLINAGAVSVKNKLLYRDSRYTVLSASINVDTVDTEYTAVGYIKVRLYDGTVKTIYSADSASRSVVEVASKAIYDLSDERSGIYQNDSIYNDGGKTQYSPYSADIQRKLSGYVGL